jgi:hypothetical protein
MAHEQPVIFYSLVLGSVGESLSDGRRTEALDLAYLSSLGPVMALAVPPIRKSMGWKPAERVPTTYPSTNPQRPSHVFWQVY